MLTCPFNNKLSVNCSGGVIMSSLPTMSSHVEPQHQITRDASLLGWGAEHDGVSTGGSWTHVEAQYHITTWKCWLYI